MPDFNSPFDLQIAAVRNDESAEGVLRTRQTTGGSLVRVPFIKGQFSTTVTGTSTISPNSGIVYNRDGTGYVAQVSVPATVADSAVITLPFSGRAFGLRWRNLYSENTRFSVLIDGVGYEVDTGIPFLRATPAWNSNLTYDQECAVVIADDLPDGQHVAQIVFSPNVSGAISILLYGYMVEQRLGYKDYRRTAMPLAAGTLTNLQVAIDIINGGPDIGVAVGQTLYFNSDTSARTITIQNNGTTINQLILAPAGTPGCSGYMDWGGVQLTSLITHACDVTGKVNFMNFELA